MSGFETPTGAGDGDSFDPRSSSAEDVFRQVEKNLNPENLSREDAVWMTMFLQRFNIYGADEIKEQELTLLWQNLDKNPSLLKDFAYTVFDMKTKLQLSEYPLAPTLTELLEYSADLAPNSNKRDSDEGRFSLRVWMVEKNTVPNLKKFHFNSERIKQIAFGEVTGQVREAEAIRFLGWLVGQDFMAGAPNRFLNFLAENEIDERNARTTHLAAMCTKEVIEALDSLEARSKIYRTRYSMELDAIPRYEDAILSMKGIYNICNDVLLGKPEVG